MKVVALLKMFRIFLFVLLCYQVQSKGLKEEFSWTFINYVWPENDTLACPAQEKVPPMIAGLGDFVFPSHTDKAPKRGRIPIRNRNGQEEQAPEYTLANNIPMGATRNENKLFITVPRRREGIPATLCYVDLNCPARYNVPLRPYPNWKMNKLHGRRPKDTTDLSTPFVSVYRTTVDPCGRLWFVDMGTLEYPTGRVHIQQFTLVVMDLKTDQVIRRFTFSTDDANPQSTLASVTVDVTKDTCDDAFAYIPDLVNNKVLVYSWRENDAWRVNQLYFFPDPLSGDFNISGNEFQWNDGVFSLTLSDPAPNGHRTVFFHPMVSTKEFSCNTRIFRDRSLATRSYHESDFKIVGERGRNGQSSTHELQSSTGIFLMGGVSRYGLFCWNIKKGPLTPANLGEIHADEEKMIYPSDVKIDSYDNVWMMTNSMPVFLYSELNYNKVNFRVWTNSIADAVAGTECE